MKPFSLEEYLKNPNRKVVTRMGTPVRIICTDFNNKIYPVVGEIQGVFTPEPFTKDGAYRELVCTDYDLFFASEKHEGWINLFKDSDIKYVGYKIFESKEEAEKVGSTATIKIEWEE